MFSFELESTLIIFCDVIWFIFACIFATESTSSSSSFEYNKDFEVVSDDIGEPDNDILFDNCFIIDVAWVGCIFGLYDLFIIFFIRAGPPP